MNSCDYLIQRFYKKCRTDHNTVEEIKHKLVINNKNSGIIKYNL